MISYLGHLKGSIWYSYKSSINSEVILKVFWLSANCLFTDLKKEENPFDSIIN